MASESVGEPRRKLGHRIRSITNIRDTCGNTLCEWKPGYMTGLPAPTCVSICVTRRTQQSRSSWTVGIGERIRGTIVGIGGPVAVLAAFLVVCGSGNCFDN